jgi:type II secretory pathway component PulJ
MMVMDEMQQLREEVKRPTQENQELRERLAAVEAINKQLVALPGQNSRNSHWPSSRDKSRQKTKSLRSKPGRKAGGQAGHEGHTLAFQPEPDVIEQHRPSECQHCQGSLAEVTAASTATFSCRTSHLDSYLRFTLYVL